MRTALTPVRNTLLALGAVAAAAGASPAQGQVSAGRLLWGLPQAAAARDDVVAQAYDSVLSTAELDDLLLIRRAGSEEGRAALRHLAESKLLQRLGKQNGIEPSDAELERRVREFDREIRASGAAEGLAGHLRTARLSRDEFKRYLALAQVQETLTRRALGLADDRPVTADQQKLWIQDELAQRGFQPIAPPWPDGIAARSSDFTISGAEFLAYLRQRLPLETLRDDCYQLLLAKRMQARMPDLAPEKLRQAFEAEIQRRRDEAAADPRHKGIPLDQILAAQGLVVSRLADDPAVRISALAKLWVERRYDEDAVQRVYQDERQLFDGLFGPAYEVDMLFLRAAAFKNEFIPRTFDEAERELAELAKRARTREELRELARARTEDAETREAGGALGWVSPLTPRVPREVREEVARRLAQPEAGASGLVGPLRLANGACLLWIGRRRPAPAWPAMAVQVRTELRRRFVEDVLPRSALVTVYEEP